MTRSSDLTDRLNGAVLFTISLHGWMNACRIPSKLIQDERLEKESFRVTKQLVDSPEFRAILRFQTDTKEWCKKRSMPSFIRDSVFFVKRDQVERFEAYLASAEEELQRKVAEFLAVYPDRIEEAKAVLGPYFDKTDYPTPAELARRFYFEHSWFKLDVADGLPSSVRSAEVKKLQESYENARLEIILALRESFQELLDYAINRMGDDDDGNPKVLRKADAMVERLKEFFETFEARNFLDDVDLSSLVSQAKSLLGDVSPVRLAKRQTVRDQVRGGFEKIKTVVDGLVENAPRRSFFTDEEGK
jgi:hypothetical protein